MTVHLHGMAFSVYVRIARLTMEEKAIAYDLIEIDPFVEGGPGEEYLARHPFGRIPALDHNGFWLYETGAIARYLDEAFRGPPLQPSDARSRARMNQLIGIADSYAYRAMVWDVYVERMNKPKRGEASDETKIAAGLEQAKTCLRAIGDIMADNPWLVGQSVTLADLWLGPMIDYFVKTPEGAAIFKTVPALTAWWQRMSSRPSMAATPYAD
jgi:glutathione S-transferase